MFRLFVYAGICRKRTEAMEFAWADDTLGMNNFNPYKVA